MVEEPKTAKSDVRPSRIQVFNRALFDRRDPTEDMGFKLPGFSRSFVLTVAKKEAESVVLDLYQEIFARLTDGTLGEAESEVVSYGDAKYSNIEAPRNYILVTHRTVRGSRLSVLIRSFAMGDGLYLAFDSLLLGKTNRLKVLSYLLLSLSPLLGLLFRQSVKDAGVTTNLYFTALLCFEAFWFVAVWSKFIRALRFHGEFKRAFAECFVAVPDLHSFNSDDVMFFFKSVLPLVVNSSHEVFERRGLPIISLDEILKEINNVVSIDTKGGSLTMVNSSLGIANNK